MSQLPPLPAAGATLLPVPPPGDGWHRLRHLHAVGAASAVRHGRRHVAPASLRCGGLDGRERAAACRWVVRRRVPVVMLQAPVLVRVPRVAGAVRELRQPARGHRLLPSVVPLGLRGRVAVLALAQLHARKSRPQHAHNRSGGAQPCCWLRKGRHNHRRSTFYTRDAHTNAH